MASIKNSCCNSMETTVKYCGVYLKFAKTAGLKGSHTYK